MKWLSFLAFAIFAFVGSADAQLTPSAPQQVSVGIGGTAPDGKSEAPAIPPNADIVVFQSAASNLVVGDTNQATDIFLADVSNSLSRVSVSSTGEQSDGNSEEAAVSPVFPDGSFAIAFSSSATNLVPQLGVVTEKTKQIYLRIPAINKTVLVSRSLTVGAIGGNGDSTHASVTGIDEKAGRRYLVAYTTLATDVFSDGGGAMPGTTPIRKLLLLLWMGLMERYSSRQGMGASAVAEQMEISSIRFLAVEATRWCFCRTPTTLVLLTKARTRRFFW